MTDALRQAKFAKLEGFDSIEELMEAVFSDSVSPAICMNEPHERVVRESELYKS